MAKIFDGFMLSQDDNNEVEVRVTYGESITFFQTHYDENNKETNHAVVIDIKTWKEILNELAQYSIK